MKTKLIAFCVSSVLIGTGIVFNMNQDVSVPTVEKFTEDTSLSVRKHEDAVSEHEKVDTEEKAKDVAIKEIKSKEATKEEQSTSKSESKSTSVSSEGKKQNSKKVLLRVLLVQIKKFQLPTVLILQINQTMML